MDKLGTIGGQQKHRVASGRLDHWVEGLIVVDDGPLGEARRTQRALYRSRVSSKLNLCLKIHLPVKTLEPTGRGIKSQVLLLIKLSYSSSLGWRQDGSARVARTEVGTGENGDDEVADNVSLSAGSQKPRFVRVVIG
jgi:hypothetical protein